MVSSTTSIQCSAEQMYWRGVLQRPPICADLDKVYTIGVAFHEDAEENVEERMLEWRQQELAVFGSGPVYCETERQKSYVACRQDALAWLSYILLEYDTPQLLPKAVLLLDAYAPRISFAGGTPDGVNHFPMVERPKDVASNEVLISLMAIVRMIVKMSPLSESGRIPGELLAPAVITGIFDCATRQPRPLSELVQLVVHEEQNLFSALHGRTWLATPLDWATAYLCRMADQDPHCCSCSRSMVYEWANRLMNMIPVTQVHPSSALGLAACVLGFIHSGILKPYSAWEMHLEFMQIHSNTVAVMQMEHWTQLVSVSLDEVLVCVERTVVRYCNEVLLCIGVDAHSCQDGDPLQSQSDDPVQGKEETTHDACDCNSTAEPEATKDKIVLMINKIPRAANERDLLHCFKDFNVSGARIRIDSKGISRCYGFLLFPEHTSAQQALDACTLGQVTMPDHLKKIWILEAEWARSSWGRVQQVEHDENLQENEHTADMESPFKPARLKCNVKLVGTPGSMDVKGEGRLDNMNGKTEVKSKRKAPHPNRPRNARKDPRKEDLLKTDRNSFEGNLVGHKLFDDDIVKQQSTRDRQPAHFPRRRVPPIGLTTCETF